MHHPKLLATNALSQPTGFSELDACLPGGGWPRGQIVEIFTAARVMSGLRLLLPCLAALSHQRRWLTWIAPPHIPSVSARWRMDLTTSLLVHKKHGKDMVKVAEQALASGLCSVVLFWLQHQPTPEQLQRLHIAAATGGAWSFVFRPFDAATQPSSALLRLKVMSEPQLLTVLMLESGDSVAVSNCGTQFSAPVLRLRIDDGFNF